MQPGPRPRLDPTPLGERAARFPALWHVLRVLALLTAVLLFAVTAFVVGHVERTYGEQYSAMRPRPDRIALVDLPASRRARGRPLPGLERWSAAAQGLGFELEHLEPSSLAELSPDRYAAIVLPAQERLEDEEWQAALALCRQGLGLVLSGHTGARHGNGRRRARMLLEDVAAGGRFERWARPGRELRVSVRGPLVAGLASGQRLALRGSGPAIVRRGAGSLQFTGAGEPHAALLHARFADAPVAWIAATAERFEDHETAQALLANLLAWAARRPLAELRIWPGAVAAAALVPAAAADVERLLAADFPGVHVAGPHWRKLDESRLLGALLTEFADVQREAGVFALPVAAQWLERPDRARIEASLLSDLLARDVWVGGAGDLEDWWRRRASLRLEVAHPRVGEVRVTLRNEGEAAVEAATARVYLPVGARAPRRVRSSRWFASPVVRVGADRTWVDLVSVPLDPQESVSYSFRY